MKSIVVLISGNGSNLQAIIDQIDNEKINGKIVAVISNIDGVYGLQRAEQAGINNLVVSHKDYASREEYDTALLANIERFSPDLIVLAGFMRILTPYFVNSFTGKMLNVHPSLLPKYKGLNTHQRAIDDDEPEHGASIHFVSPELDGGPVILQAKVPVFPEDSATDLAARVQEQERQIYPMVVKWFCEDRLSMQNGKAYLDNEVIGDNGYAAN
ncbi:phosphoribosylglycinamide formyltransferase [Alteromonadaceae bacterium M269]|nr:phosphoribosylglycinamide formyltransferase [Alteromonadaceae bacterium M269]